MNNLLRSMTSMMAVGMFLSLTGCGGSDGGPAVSSSATPTGATASLQWDPVQPAAGEPPILGYYIHYGTQPTNQPGSCSYQDSTYVSAPNGTVTGLNRGTRYYFAVSAYNGAESGCSNEVSTDT